jgi:hypothetical protein
LGGHEEFWREKTVRKEIEKTDGVLLLDKLVLHRHGDIRNFEVVLRRKVPLYDQELVSMVASFPENCKLVDAWSEPRTSQMDFPVSSASIWWEHILLGSKNRHSKW